MDISTATVALLGGTGAQGSGLAYRFAGAAISTFIGSRSAERAATAAAEINADLGAGAAPVTGLDNAAAAERADIVIAAIPWDGHGELLASLRQSLQGRILVDCVAPLGFGKQGPYVLEVPEGSAAQQAEQLLPDTRVVGAFHHVSAELLADRNLTEVEGDVLVLGDDRDATDTVRALADAIPGMRGVYGGRLRNCGQIEALTGNLIAINRRYKTHAGIRITGV